MAQFHNILVAVDASQGHDTALSNAVHLAEKQQAALCLVDVVPTLSWAQRIVWPEADEIQSLMLSDRTRKLQKLARSLRARGLEVKAKVLMGRTGEELVRQVLRGKHDLVVRTAKGPHSRRPHYFSGTSFELLRNCPCPIWLCAPTAPTGPQRMLVAIDPTPERPALQELNRQILLTARLIAALLGATLDVLHVWNVYGERVVKDYMKNHDFEELQRTLEGHARNSLDELVHASGIDVAPEHLHFVRGEASVEIARFVREHLVDVLVMGTLGRGGVSGLLMGNTAELLMHQIRCAVIALKPAGFESRVRLRPRKEDAEITVTTIPPLPPIP